MNQLNFGFWLIIAQLGVMGSSAVAQITSDTTLPNNSAVTRNGEQITIDEGTVNGNNLFHSFSEFNVNTGETAIFNNRATIDNIITRVTGGQFSNIDGLIQANSTANLFLLNPSGIQFGANASLNIGGSFVGSTAESFLFEDGSIYSATNPAAPPLLTVNVPLGLQYGSSANPIQVQGANLEVESGQTLTLAGGDLDIVGGKLQASNGRISLASATAGILTLDGSLGIAGHSDTTKFGNINLGQQSVVKVTGVSHGIDITTGNLTVTEKSLLESEILVPGEAGDITIEAHDSILISQQNTDLISQQNTDLISQQNTDLISQLNTDLRSQENTDLRSLSYGEGNAGNIYLDANDSIKLSSGIRLGSITLGKGNAGNIHLVANNSIKLSEGVALSSQNGIIDQNLELQIGEGNGGKITIETPTLQVIDSIISSLSMGPKGNAGEIEVKAEVVELRGKFVDSQNKIGSTGLFVSVINKSVGEGGNIIVNSERLIISDGAHINASNFHSKDRTPPGQGPVGNIEINANSVFLSNKGLITTNATNGNRGNIIINASELQLEGKSEITAETESNQGGNITFTLNDELLLSRNSNISATAGKAGSGGDGGNITITSGFLIAPPFEDSNIKADAFEGKGGNIAINANGIFGIKFREGPTNLSDITASSEFGLAGTVAINNPDVDPTSGLVELPSQVSDPSDQVIAGCAAVSGNSFTITGKGGLPEDPTTTIREQTVLSDLRDFTALDEKKDLPAVKKQVSLHPPRSIVQVKGWIINQDGEVELVAALPQETSNLKHPNCSDL